MASSKSKLTEAQLIEGIIDKMLDAIMKGRLKKIEPILKNASPELARQAKKADKANQEFKKAAEEFMKARTGKKGTSTADLRKAGKFF
jgi:vacuolar-type H+-ATPase subunit E/Vma4